MTENCSRCPASASRTLAADALCETCFTNITAKIGNSLPTDPDAADTPTGYRYTDAGNARLLADLHGDRLRFVTTWGTWLAWDGKRWCPDHADAQAIEAGKDIARHLLARVPDGTKSERVELTKHANRSESAAGIAAALRLTATLPTIRLDHHELDADYWRLTVTNGTLDLLTGLLVPHEPAHLITKYVGITFDKYATCPQWLAFLERVLPDPEVRDFVQRAFGYSLTGSVQEQVLFFLIGLGANGKSVLLNVLRQLLGDYAVIAPRDLLLTQRHEPHPTSTAGLFGARVATASEVEAGARLAEAKVKELTGGDDLTARRMREDFWKFTPTHKLWLAANYRPVISGADEGIWRRIRVIPFEVTIPPDERDPGLFDKMKRELPGILTWALNGHRAWREQGLGLPHAVDMATAAYRAEQDVIGQFLDALGYRPQEGASVLAGDLRKRYEQWCESDGLTPLGPQAWAQGLRARGLRDVRRHRGRHWEGLSDANLFETAA